MSAISMTDEKIYTVKEVAQILKLNVRTVYKMIADKEIDAFTVRDVYRIRQSALDAVMRGKKGKALQEDDDRSPA